MTVNNRIDTLKLGDDNHVEDEAIDSLSQLARAHGAESRAADIVAEAVVLGNFRFSPALGWLRWDGRKWDSDDIAEPRVVEEVRLFMDRTERDYRVKATFADATMKGLMKAVNDRVVAQKRADGVDEDTIAASADLLGKENSIDTYGTDEEKATYNEAASAYLDSKKQGDMWLNLLSAGKISSITKLCRGMEGVITRSTEFDAHPDLINCHNGVADMRTGELLAHDPNLLLTHLAGGDYDPKATSPLWTKALQAVHPDCLDWFQTRMGQSATGHTPDDDVLVVAEGGGENGKSAVMSVFLRALGTYGRLISHRVLIAQPGQHPTELMDLRGLRFALLEETPEEGRLDTHQLKTTIGTPQITARKMRRDDVTFDTSHSLWVNTNFLPQVDTTDHGTWRRLKAMPWPFKFVKPGVEITEDNERPGDLTLKTKLRYDTGVPTAALSWVIQGAIKWYANNQTSPADPKPVADATSAWRQSSDVGYRFATERLVADARYFITADTMKTQFLTMLESEGKAPWSNQTINNRLPASMQAAGVAITSNPKMACALSEDLKESRPGDLGGDQWPTNQFGQGALVVPEKGKRYRVWRGVRFQTKQEMSGGHLKVVKPVKVPPNQAADDYAEAPF